MLIRTTPLRRLLSHRQNFLHASNQRRWAQVHDVRFLTTSQQPSAILEKYREKLDRKAKEEGLKSIDELKEAYAGKIKGLRQKDAITPPSATDANSSSPTPSTTSPLSTSPSSSPKSSSGATGVKPLSAILDLEKVASLPDRELLAIWRLRHADIPQSLCAVIPAATYTAMEAAAQKAPQFVLPVPHPEQGAEIHFLQWTFDAPTKTSTVLFTQLADYKSRGEFAQPHTTITHHTDLSDERGLVLMQGQVMEGRGTKIEDAQFLIMCLQKFYGAWQNAGTDRNDGPSQLLEWFSKGDERFSLEKLIDETERLV